ncbi:MAG: hypothetical protein LEGION0403_FIIPPAGN_02742 [Legionella sp.]|uniref:hypothetical protein n=1 Tax=Legionella sp. TaxID=459 RepID=UPI003D0C1459
MITSVDERNGLVKYTWSEIRHRFEAVEPKFTEIVDHLSPDHSYPLYIAYYSYGDTDADTQSSLFPNINGGYFRITDPDVPEYILHHLGYSANNTPLGMLLEKELECYIDLKNEQIIIPWLIYKPGDIFPLSTILNKTKNRVYTPNGLLSSTAGVRSTFVLPNIGAAINHSNLQRDFNIKSRPPKSTYDHWHIFREIVNSNEIQSDWRCCIAYFSEKWLTSLHNDVEWKGLKQYLNELAWRRYEYDRNRIYYDITFSIIQKNRNLKPNPYLVDTAKHLFATALGDAPGYVPAVDNSALPVNTLQQVFVESYGLKKYWPTIMQAKHFNFETDSLPIYYSLQHPSTRVFSPSSRSVSSTINEMRELQHIMGIFINDLLVEGALSSDTVIGEIAKYIEFQYFHNIADSHKIMKESTDLLNIDMRFKKTLFPSYEESTFAADASFLRGCISMSSAKTPT